MDKEFKENLDKVYKQARGWCNGLSDKERRHLTSIAMRMIYNNDGMIYSNRERAGLRDEVIVVSETKVI